jgi:hypothetical protein
MPIPTHLAMFGISGTELMIIAGIALLFYGGSNRGGFGGPSFPVLIKNPIRSSKPFPAKDDQPTL